DHFPARFQRSARQIVLEASDLLHADVARGRASEVGTTGQASIDLLRFRHQEENVRVVATQNAPAALTFAAADVRHDWARQRLSKEARGLFLPRALRSTKQVRVLNVAA